MSCCSLKLTMVGIFTVWTTENTTNQGLELQESGSNEDTESHSSFNRGGVVYNS